VSLPKLTALLAVASWLVACSSAADAEARQSAGRVARAIEVLRDAPNAGKPEALSALGKTACSGPDVCETRAACQSAYAEHVDALSLLAAAKLKLADAPQEAARLLGSAQSKLTAAETKVMTCTEREQALRRRYKL
jgi:hypothetical protein